MGWDSNPR